MKLGILWKMTKFSRIDASLKSREEDEEGQDLLEMSKMREGK